MKETNHSRPSSAHTSLASSLIIPANLLALICFLTFHPVLTAEFTNSDEYDHVVESELIRDISPAGVWNIITSLDRRSYYPIRDLSFAVDYLVWELHPRGYHLTNLVLHTLNALLFYFLLLAITRDSKSSSPWWAFLFSALFALHPLTVEPVAWVSGREELLMLLFGLLSIHAFMVWLANRKWRWYTLCYLSVAASCMSNVCGAVTPAILTGWLLSHYLRKGTPPPLRALGRSVLTTTPMLLTGAAFFALKLLVKVLEGATADGLSSEFQITLTERLLTVIRLYAINIRQFIWPAQLAWSYPRVSNTLAPDISLLAGAVLIVATVVLAFRSRRSGHTFFGWIWFLAALAPSSQIIPHHIQRGDRLLYYPLAGLCVLLAGFTSALETRFKRYASVLLVCIIAVFFTQSYSYSLAWRSSVSMLSHAISVSPTVAALHHNIAHAYLESGDTQSAEKHYKQAITLDPAAAETYVNLALLMKRLDRLAEARQHLTMALHHSPNNPIANHAAADELYSDGKLVEAELRYRLAIQEQPDFVPAYMNLGVLLADQNRISEAALAWEMVLRKEPTNLLARLNLAMACEDLKELSLARQHYEAILILDPMNASASNALSSLNARGEDE